MSASDRRVDVCLAGHETVQGKSLRAAVRQFGLYTEVTSRYRDKFVWLCANVLQYQGVRFVAGMCIEFETACAVVAANSVTTLPVG